MADKTSSKTTDMSTSPSFSYTTTAEEVATAFSDEIKGKNGTLSIVVLPPHQLPTVLITGTSINGLGFEAARVLAKYAKLVVITGYNEERSVFLSWLVEGG
jgi:hypothetical protein